MKKRLSYCLAMVLLTVALLSGCGAKAQLPTTIGSFAVVRVTMLDTYGDTMQADSGQKLCVVAMRANDAIDETKYKSYFCADDGSSVAIINIDGTDFSCVAVAYQGASHSSTVEYALVFKVPESAASAKTITITAPGQPAVTVKL